MAFLRSALATLAAAGAAATLAACGASGLPSTSSLTTSADASSTTAAYPAVASEQSDRVATPFGDPTTAAPGGREVIANPTVADIMAPSPLPEMSWGRPDAPVTIVQYASLTCPHCRDFHKMTYPQLKRRFIDTGKVRYILREFPIGKQSGNATVALRCAPPDKYLTLYSKFMEQQPAWVSQEVRLDPIFNVAHQVGMTRAQFDACYQNQGMIENLKWVKERGRKLGIIGTPNFFIGNTLVKKELSIDEIAYLVQRGGSGGTPTAAATSQ